MRGPLAWIDAQLGVPPVEPGRPGDPGLFGPGSAVWTIGRERALLAGGPAALLMQIAHPLVAAAVAGHSGFQLDPFARLRATLEAVLAVSYGDELQARAAARKVMAVHRHVRGRLESAAGPFPAGTAYDATDPELALWVHATLVSTALDAFDLLVRPLREGERARYFEEAKIFAAMFGVTDEVMPRTFGDFRTYVDRMLEGPVLFVTDEARLLAEQIVHPPVPVAVRPILPVTGAVTAALLPGRLRQGFGLGWGPGRRAVASSAAGSVRLAIRALPPRARYWPHYLHAMTRDREARATR